MNFDPSQLPLRDIHLPADIAWWPPAFGWWLLGAVVVGLVLALGYRIWRLRRHRAARRSLNEIMAELNTGAEPTHCAQRASIVLRRFAMTIDRETPEVAGMTGERWSEYLAGLARGSTLADEDDATLLDLPYFEPDRVTPEQAMVLCRACVAWVDAQPART